MVSRGTEPRVRKRPEERRAEILAAASDLALRAGLEHITLRAVADELGVRPGLITHYFPAADDLVIAAFVQAAVTERERFFPADATGSPIDRLAGFLRHIDSGASFPLARLWLNARHLARFSEALRAALAEQDALDHARLTRILADGVASGEFAEVDPPTTATRILVAVDGSGSYVNTGEVDDPVVRTFAADVTAWLLGLEPAALTPAAP